MLALAPLRLVINVSLIVAPITDAPELALVRQRSWIGSLADANMAPPSAAVPYVKPVLL